MISLRDYVTRIGTDKPIGMVESLNSDGTAIVRWGVADGRRYADIVAVKDLEVLGYIPVQPDEVLLRQAGPARGTIEEV